MTVVPEGEACYCGKKGCLEEHMQEIRDKVSRRNTFEEGGGFVRNCHYREGTAALGAALHVIDDFIARI